MTRRGARKGRDRSLVPSGTAGRPPSQRQLRVGEALRHALTRVLAREELDDPALAGVMVTVTEVRMSPDLRNATAFVVPFGGGDAGALVGALNRAGGYFRGRLAHEVELRNVPSVRFTADPSFDAADRVERLLHDPAVARDLVGDAGRDAAAGGDDTRPEDGTEPACESGPPSGRERK